jgi:hypothetical protein
MTADTAMKEELPAAEAEPTRRRSIMAGLNSIFASTPDRPRTRRRTWLAMLVVAVGTVVSLLRTTGTGPLQSIWEEDGRDILTDPLFMSGARVLARPAVGYFVLVPRIQGEIAAFFPLAWSAAVLSISSALLCALMTLLVYHTSGAHLKSRLARFMVSAPMLVAPVAENIRSEIYNRPVCLHFFALYTVFWVLLWVPARRSGRIVAISTVFLSAFSTILTVGFIPLALLRAITRRDRTSISMLLILGSGAVANLVARQTGYATRGVTMRPDPLWALGDYFFWGLPTAMLGYRATESLEKLPSQFWGSAFWQVVGDNALIIGASWLIVAAIVVLAATRRFTRPAWLLALVAGGHSIGLLFMMLIAEGTSEYRYLYPMEMLLFAALTMLLLPSDRFSPTKALTPLVVFAVFVAAISSMNYRWDNTYRAQAPRWTDQLDRAAADCQSHPLRQKVYVRSAPAQFWSVVVIPCSRLRSRGAQCADPSCAWIDAPAYVDPRSRPS